MERFPVTILLGFQVTAMIVVPAALKGTQPLGLITAICAVAVAVSFYVELMMQPLRAPRGSARPVAVRAAAVVLAGGATAVIASALGGRGSYAVQLGLAQESAVVAIAAPFTLWVMFGTALILWLHRRGDVSRRSALWTVTLVSGLYLWEGLTRAIIGQSAALVLTVLVLAVFAKVIRLRTIAITLLLIPLVWPPIYDLRDEIRRSTVIGPAKVSADAPLERLQLDAQMAHVGRLVPAPSGLEPLDFPTLLRIGILPGFLDSDRPRLDTGSRISVALGGTATNSQSATMLGNIFIFEGWAGVVVFAAVLSLAMGALLRRDNPWALASVGLVYSYAMSFNATYPDVIPKLLQAGFAMLAAYVLTRTLSRTCPSPTSAVTPVTE